MIIIGLLLGLVGIDISSGVARFTFGAPDLWEGIDFVLIAVGIFAFSEIARTLESSPHSRGTTSKIHSLLPSREDVRRMTPSILRGSALGTVIGVLPGAGLSLSSFFAYSLERRFARHPEQFGHGAIEGVAGPESANNAAAQTAFIPTLTLGIPGSATMALMLGAMIVHNIQPGPQVMTNNPELFWGLIVSMWIGNLMLIVLNLPLIGLWIKLLQIPYRLLFPAILVFCCIGVYSVSYSTFDLYVTAAFGIFGYILYKLNYEPAPLLLGFVLGPMIEENFRRALVLSDGDFSVFVTRPIAASLLLIALMLIIFALLPSLREKRETAFTEE